MNSLKRTANGLRRLPPAVGVFAAATWVLMWSLLVITSGSLPASEALVVLSGLTAIAVDVTPGPRDNFVTTPPPEEPNSNRTPSGESM